MRSKPRPNNSILALAALAMAMNVVGQDDVQLPGLPAVGQIPQGAPVLDVDPWGAMDPLPGNTLGPDVILRVDRRCPAARVGGALTLLRTSGVERVTFAVSLLGDQSAAAAGGFTLALPPPQPAAGARVVTGIDVELHSQRPGVPPESVGPPMRRLLRGWEEDSQPTVGVRIPRDAPMSQALRSLAALAHVDVACVHVDWDGPAAGECGSYAIDVRAVARLPVRPIVARIDNAVLDDPVGFAAAPRWAVPPTVLDGARRPGGVTPGPKPAAPEALTKLIDDCSARLATEPWNLQRLPATSSDVRRASLCALAMVISRKTLRTPEAPTLHRAVGDLLAVQRDDGMFAADLEAHAWATLTLAEVAEASGARALGGAVDDALAALIERQNSDGGWGADGPSRAVATALGSWALAAEWEPRRKSQPPRRESQRGARAWLNTVPSRDTTGFQHINHAIEAHAAASLGSAIGGQPLAAATEFVARESGDPAVQMSDRCRFFVSMALQGAGGAIREAWFNSLEKEWLPNANAVGPADDVALRLIVARILARSR